MNRLDAALQNVRTWTDRQIANSRAWLVGIVVTILVALSAIGINVSDLITEIEEKQEQQQQETTE